MSIPDFTESLASCVAVLAGIVSNSSQPLSPVYVASEYNKMLSVLIQEGGLNWLSYVLVKLNTGFESIAI